MFAVIFEVEPKAGHVDEYLAHAKVLKPELEQIDGFIDNERFASRRIEGRVLSLSTWRDEKALIRWRTLAVHHEIQKKGRFAVFADYHLRVGEITSDTHVPPGQTLREQRFDVTEAGPARVVTIVEVAAGADQARTEDILRGEVRPAQTAGLVNSDVYDSIYTPGKALVLTSWRDEELFAAASRPVDGATAPRRRTVRVIRDYGMDARHEAPQYYAEVDPRSSP